MLAVLAVVIWTAGTGSPAWIRDLARGLLVSDVTAAGSIPIADALQHWTDGLSTALLGAIPAGDVGTRLVDALTLPGADLVLVAFWSALLLLAGVLQYVVMLFRDGAVRTLTVVLPAAAAGQFSRGRLLWLPKVTGWLLAFLTFKPTGWLCSPGRSPAPGCSSSPPPPVITALSTTRPPAACRSPSGSPRPPSG